MSKIITCEQVSNGHPDKICDQIADGIVTDILQHDKNARVAIECLLKKSQLFIAGEVTTDYRPNYNQIVHDVFNRIGAEKLGWNLTELLRIGILVDKQSPDIALGVDKRESVGRKKNLLFRIVAHISMVGRAYASNHAAGSCADYNCEHTGCTIQ